MPVHQARYTRGTSFLASAEQRKRIDAFVSETSSLGDVMREVTEYGLAVMEGKMLLIPMREEGENV